MATIPEQPLIALNEDQRAVAMRHIKGLHSALQMIYQGIEGVKPLTEDLAENCLKVSEFDLRDLCKALGIETNGVAEMDARNAQLREANARIRDLEAQIGKSQSPEQVQMAIKTLARRLKAWWDIEGFGHVGELKFDGHGIDAKFSCTLFGNFHLTCSQTPVSDKDRRARWHASLTERGFVLCLLEGERDPELKDCDQNRQALIALFTQHMPSAQVIGFRSVGHKGQFVLRDFEVYIRDYADIQALAVPDE